MRASDPITIADLYEWLPPDGETSVSYQYDGSRLTVEIHFEDAEDFSIKRKLNLVFTGVVSMHVLSTPGVDTLDLQCDDSISTGNISPSDVIEYLKSEAAEAWSQHFGWKLRHFHVYFASANERLIVFARECVVE